MRRFYMLGTRIILLDGWPVCHHVTGLGPTSTTSFQRDEKKKKKERRAHTQHTHTVKHAHVHTHTTGPTEGFT